MLTVKHIEVTGHENLYPALRVSYQPRTKHEGASDSAGEYSAACVFIDTPKGDTVPLGSWGAFYVMNDAGKTVAKYDLGGWDTPPKNVSISGGTWTAGSPPNVTITRVG